MNKKNLSVVMAGAMLATSVAPVLAAESTNTYEVTSGNVGLLIDKLDTYFEEAPKFDKTVETVADLRGKSVYAYQVREAGKSDWTTLAVTEDVTGEGTTDTSKLKSLDFSKEYELRVINRGYRTNDDGKIVSTKADAESYVKYTAKDIQDIADAIGQTTLGVPNTSSAIDTTSITGKGVEKLGTLFDAANSKTNAVIKKVTDLKEGDLSSKGSNTSVEGLKLTLADSSSTVITLTADMECLNFDSPISSDSSVTDAASAVQNSKNTTVTGFNKLNKIVTTTGSDIEEETLYTVKIVKGDTKVDYKVTDLYDGFMLTDAGHDLLTELKDIDAKAKVAPLKYSVEIDHDILNNKFDVKITDNGTTKVVTISGTTSETDKLKTLKKWLEQRRADVDILAGDNRYETAVEIAKTYMAKDGQYVAGSGAPTNTLTDIVMVNGEALVDGLAAAPYAHAQDAPILLTKDSSLPKETKDYLKELIKGKQNVDVGDKLGITVHIVGGEAVVSRSVVNELKDMGFDVERLAGDNREATSLEVAEAMADTNGADAAGKDDAFVVGADGEADAMSIASYAAASETPIIVSRSASKGLSTYALEYLGELDGNVTIIGGENAVPASNEEELVDLLDLARVDRIAGERRQETNAMVIKKYHKGFNDILVAKDGTGNKSELVDALPVSIFASAKANNNAATAAPIVLATNSLSDAQLNEVVAKSDTTTKGTVYQVGYGVNTNVLHKIVEKLGLANK